MKSKCKSVSHYKDCWHFVADLTKILMKSLTRDIGEFCIFLNFSFNCNFKVYLTWVAEILSVTRFNDLLQLQ